MKRLSLFLLFCAVATALPAQRISQTFSDVPMSDVLKELQRQTKRYDIIFIYDELEDFRVTTEVKNQAIPDAIQQCIGFYPIRMTMKGEREIYVECTHKANQHLTGHIIDERGQPVAYANVALLSPTDSTIVSGGVTGEGGLFVIPTERTDVLVRISHVGYKTLYKMCTHPDMGTIQMQPEVLMLDGVEVRAEAPTMEMRGSSLVMNVENTLLSRIGTAEDVLSRVPMIIKRKESFEILGRGTPTIYVNGRKLQDLSELRNIQSDNIKSVEVIQNPGVRYDATMQSVIVIHTKRMVGEGFGVEAMSWSRKDHGFVNNERLNMTYRTGGLELFANLFGAYNDIRNKGFFEETVTVDTLWNINNSHADHTYNPFFEGRIGFNFQANDHHSFGGFYQNTYDRVKTHATTDDVLLANGLPYDRLQNASTHLYTTTPKHQANFYYIGKVGKWNIDFNADYTRRKKISQSTQNELSDNYADRDVHTRNLNRSQMVAEKLILTHPLGHGELELGEEYTNTHWESEFENEEGYIANSNTEQDEYSLAPFVQLSQQVGKLHLTAGVRYEHVSSEYFSGGIRHDEQSRTYDNLFPSLSASTTLKNCHLSFSYAQRCIRPSYWLLSNDVLYENRLNYQTGNPYLLSVKNHNFNLMGVYKWLYMNVFFGHTVNPIVYTAESYEGDSKINLVTHKNYHHSDWLSVSLSAQKTFGAWSPQWSVSLHKQWFEADFEGKPKRFGNPILQLQLNNLVSLHHDWLLRTDFNWVSKGHQQNVHKDRVTATLNLSVSKDFCHGKLNVRLEANDVFKNKSHVTLYSNRFCIRKIDDDDSRNIVLSLRYRLNVTRSKYKGTGAGNEEKSRL